MQPNKGNNNNRENTVFPKQELLDYHEQYVEYLRNTPTEHMGHVWDFDTWFNDHLGVLIDNREKRKR